MTARVVPPLPPETLLTAEEFLTLPEPETGRLELHDGRVVEVAPAGPRHSVVQGLLLGADLAWCRAHDAGLPAPELTCRLTRRRVVIPDVAYVRPGPRWDAAWRGGPSTAHRTWRWRWSVPATAGRRCARRYSGTWQRDVRWCG